VFATAILLPQLRAVAIFLSQLRATAAQFFEITGHSAIAVAPQLRRILTAIQNMGYIMHFLKRSCSCVTFFTDN
jgi:hypothetical protein